MASLLKCRARRETPKPQDSLNEDESEMATVVKTPQDAALSSSSAQGGSTGKSSTTSNMLRRSSSTSSTNPRSPPSNTPLVKGSSSRSSSPSTGSQQQQQHQRGPQSQQQLHPPRANNGVSTCSLSSVRSGSRRNSLGCSSGVGGSFGGSGIPFHYSYSYDSVGPYMRPLTEVPLDPRKSLREVRRHLALDGPRCGLWIGTMDVGWALAMSSHAVHYVPSGDPAKCRWRNSSKFQVPVYTEPHFASDKIAGIDPGRSIGVVELRPLTAEVPDYCSTNGVSVRPVVWLHAVSPLEGWCPLGNPFFEQLHQTVDSGACGATGGGLLYFVPDVSVDKPLYWASLASPAPPTPSSASLLVHHSVDFNHVEEPGAASHGDGQRSAMSPARVASVRRTAGSKKMGGSSSETDPFADWSRKDGVHQGAAAEAVVEGEVASTLGSKPLGCTSPSFHRLRNPVTNSPGVGPRSNPPRKEPIRTLVCMTPSLARRYSLQQLSKSTTSSVSSALAGSSTGPSGSGSTSTAVLRRRDSQAHGLEVVEQIHRASASCGAKSSTDMPRILSESVNEPLTFAGSNADHVSTEAFVRNAAGGDTNLVREEEVLLASMNPAQRREHRLARGDLLIYLRAYGDLDEKTGTQFFSTSVVVSDFEYCFTQAGVLTRPAEQGTHDCVESREMGWTRKGTEWIQGTALKDLQTTHFIPQVPRRNCTESWKAAHPEVRDVDVADGNDVDGEETSGGSAPALTETTNGGSIAPSSMQSIRSNEPQVPLADGSTSGDRQEGDERVVSNSSPLLEPVPHSNAAPHSADAKMKLDAELVGGQGEIQEGDRPQDSFEGDTYFGDDSASLHFAESRIFALDSHASAFVPYSYDAEDHNCHHFCEALMAQLWDGTEILDCSASREDSSTKSGSGFGSGLSKSEGDVNNSQGALGGFGSGLCSDSGPEPNPPEVAELLVPALWKDIPEGGRVAETGHLVPSLSRHMSHSTFNAQKAIGTVMNVNKALGKFLGKVGKTRSKSPSTSNSSV